MAVVGQDPKPPCSFLKPEVYLPFHYWVCTPSPYRAPLPAGTSFTSDMESCRWYGFLHRLSNTPRKDSRFPTSSPLNGSWREIGFALRRMRHAISCWMDVRLVGATSSNFPNCPRHCGKLPKVAETFFTRERLLRGSSNFPTDTTAP